jgi:UDPglucose 6-dehydrogenase
VTTDGRDAAQGSAADADPIVAVVGLGRVGLITAVGMAELGWHVFGAEADCARAQAIRQGIVPFYEEGVEEPLRTHLASARLNVENSVSAAIERADVVFVCVGTPEGSDGAADVSELGKVAAAIGARLGGYKLIVQKSTCPVGTSEMVERVIAEHSAANGGPRESGFEVAVNPEFLREGKAMYDFLHPTRIVLGVESERAASLLMRVYRPLLDRLGRDAESGVVVTDRNTAEIVKHAANAFLATKISFANMVADLCEAAGADVEHVTRTLSMDPRIGPYLGAGIGYGGSCLPKDVRAFASVAERFGVDFSLLSQVHRVNEGRVDPFVAKVRDAVPSVDGSTLAVWGLAFKPGTDDVRDAPSLRIVDALLENGAALRLYDPRAMDEFAAHFPASDAVAYASSPEDAADGADALLVLTEWPEFLAVNLARVGEQMRAPVIVDGRNALSPDHVRGLGFRYESVGRP